MDANRAFREYATRVSFNMSLSRNQVATLREVVFWVENAEKYGDFSIETPRDKERAAGRELGVTVVDRFICGIRWLETNGLVEVCPKWKERERKRDEHKAKHGWFPHDVSAFHSYRWRITPAGEHVVALLRIAGLIPQSMRIANENAKPRAQKKTKRRRG